MQLKTFLSTRSPALSARAFAEQVGVSEARISQILAGGDSSDDLKRRIHAATGGLVTANDLLGMECGCEPQMPEPGEEAGEVGEGAAFARGAEVDDLSHAGASTPRERRKVREAFP